MKKKYQFKKLLLISGSLLLLFIASCKKDNKNNNNVTTATPKKIGFYEVKDSIYKILLMNISKIGTQTTDFDLIFDTGSGGMVIDANGVLPASMITSTGFNFTGDSTIVDGITITNQTDIIEYGDDNATTSKVYGNLAYAPVTIGDNNGNITVKRIPFFIYWKAVDSKGTKQPAHDFDVFGVSSEYDITFGNGVFITSPFSYFDPGTGLTKGFKMESLGTTNFTEQGNYVPAITLGLTAADLTSGGYSLSTLQFYPGEGYLPIFPARLAYGNNAAFNGYVLFDTGTEPYTYLQDPTAPATPAQLASGKKVSITLVGTSSFNYTYTTADMDNLTYVENPNNSGSVVSVVSLSFFENNAFLLDFQNNQLGLKND